MIKKYHLKKEIKIALFAFIALILLILIITIVVKNNKYKSSNEYKLMQIGYKENEIVSITKSLKQNEINNIINSKYNAGIAKIIDSKYFIYSNYQRYLNYRTINYQDEINSTISLVNTNRDENFYEKTFEANTAKEELLLVNKYYKLNSDFVPKDLTNIPLSYAYSDNKLSKIALDAFIKMVDAASKENIKLIASTSYRSYESQKKIYDGYVDTNSSRYADNITARPGHSDHQSGYALDISTTNKFTNFNETNEYKWLIDNSYKYGFILRYPEGKENITGFKYEPWHYRYVGVNVATQIKNENITFDEYYAYYIDKAEK